MKDCSDLIPDVFGWHAIGMGTSIIYSQFKKDSAFDILKCPLIKKKKHTLPGSKLKLHSPHATQIRQD